MDQLTRDKIQMFFNNLNLAYETARTNLGHLCACLRDADDDGVLNRNPAGGKIRVVADPRKTKTDDRKFMAIKDFRRIQNFLLEYDYRISDVNRMVLMVISQTALRVGEALALRYEDINQFKCEIIIDESWDSMHSLFKEPKTKNSIRTVPVSRTAMNKINFIAKNFSDEELQIQSGYCFRQDKRNFQTQNQLILNIINYKST
ncbi:MAG: tyrosine-type recombinase/integrase [Liquorilactobacillus satsumensis]